MATSIEELREIFPGVPVLDDEQKSALQTVFEDAVARAKAGELPESRYEQNKQEKEARMRRSKKRKDPKAPDDYATSMAKFFDRFGTEAVQGLTAETFARAHQAIRNEDGPRQKAMDVLYGDKDRKVVDSDLFFALKQVYKPLKRPNPRRSLRNG